MFGFKEIVETGETRQKNLTTTTKVVVKDKFELPPVESLPPIFPEDTKKAIPALLDITELPPIWDLPPVSELPPLPELE